MVSTSSNVLEPYNGSDPYVFVSYSHMDKNQVLPIIEFIQKQGLKVWYDKGLITGAKWRETIAERIEHCTIFLICLSPNCEFNEAGTPSMIRNELYSALDEFHKEHIFPIMLQDFNLPGGIKMALVSYQKLMKYKMTDEEFFEQLNGEIASIIPASIQESTSVKIDGDEESDEDGESMKVNFQELLQSAGINTDLLYGPSIKDKGKSSRDLSKYDFNGKTRMAKNALVLAVVKEYVRNNPNTTFKELSEVFPPHFRETYGVFKTVQEVEMSPDPDRFFRKDSDIIHLKDQDIAVCNQWGGDYFQQFVDYAIKELKFNITKAQ